MRRDKKRKEKEDGGERTKEDEGKGKRKTKEERGWRTYPVSSPPLLSLPSVLSSSSLVCLPVPFTRLYPLPAPAPARLDGNKHHINEWSKDRTSVHL